MANAIKGVFLAFVLVALFLPLDGVDGLQCYQCLSANAKSNDRAKCNEPNSNTNKEPTCSPLAKGCKTVAIKRTGGVNRGCYAGSVPQIEFGECSNSTRLGERETCVCEGDLCNSKKNENTGSGYLHESPLFIFGLALLTVVSNLGRQH